MIRVVIDSRITGDDGTLSVIAVPELKWQAYTLELPWRDNRNNLSYIPEGVYQVRWTRSPRFSRKYKRDYFTYEILNVPKRGGIRIHSGNLAGDVEKGMITHSLGCPLIGYQVGRMNNQKAILVSKPATRAFEALLNKRPFELEVKRNGLT